MFKIRFLLFPVITFANINCKRDKILCHMLRNSPKLDKKYALKVSDIIYKYSKLYKINPFLISAIFSQESRYNNKAINYTTGLSKDFKPVRVGMDYAIGQINFRTAIRYDIQIEHLTDNLEYSIQSAIKILSGFKKRYGKTDQFWWTRYNASSRHHREKYKEDVLRWF